MKTAVFGLGCVGLVSAVGLAQCGYQVVGFDTDGEKLQRLARGNANATEPGLNNALQQQLRHGHLVLTAEAAQALKNAELVFITVGTPASTDGSADLSALADCTTLLAQQLERDCLIVLRSTVPPGTTAHFQQQVQSALLLRGSSAKISIAFQPEFFQQGSALKNFHQPERLVLGAETPEVFTTLKQLYAPLQLADARILTMNVRSAELSKYAANAMLALRLSFMNDLAGLAEKNRCSY
jgi:UDPglucose 6-dehydrogenase